MDVLVCVYAEEDIFWLDKWRALEEEYENFHYHLTLSDPSDEWKGLRGRVQQHTPEISHFKERSIYLCGNPAMTADVKRLCLEEWGIPKEDVHMEGYI